MTSRAAVLATLVLLVAAGTLSAAPVTFNLTSNVGYGTMGNLLTYSSSGLNLSVTSWGLTGNSSTTLAAAATGRWSGGLGVCDSAEGTSCGDPQHTVDNSGKYDFILFQFSAPIDVFSLTMNSYGSGDSDMSYWVGTPTGSLSGSSLANLANLGMGTQIDNSGSGNRSITVNPSANVSAILIGAKVGAITVNDSYDYVKIASITATTASVPPPPVSSVPEPGTWALLGAGLVGLGFAKRRAS